MKEKVEVSLVQFGPEWLQREKNAERMRQIAEKEAERGAELVLFPELANIGYITPVGVGQRASFDSETTAVDFAVKYIKASEPVPGPTTELLGQVARKYGTYIVVGISQLHPVIPATLYNSAVSIGPSGVIGIHHKMHIPLNEKQYFYPGSTAEIYSTDIGNIGMTVCYDGSVPELSRVLALKGAEIVCELRAGGRAAGLGGIVSEVHYLRYLACVRAHENGNYHLVCNRIGTEGDTVFNGHSAVAAPGGKIIAYADSQEETTLCATLHNEELIKYRAQLSFFRDRRPEMYSKITEPLSQPYRAAALDEQVSIPVTRVEPAVYQ